MRLKSLAALFALLLAACGTGPTNLQAGGDAVAAVLQLQNTARSQVGISNLTWSDSLAKQAKAWASRCRFEHSDSSTGENLYATSSLGLTDTKSFTQAAQAWINEKRDYSYASNTCAPGKQCGHYTQVVWRDTLRVGCAAVACESGMANFRAGTLVVCEYDPPGNVSGRRPY